MDKVLVGLLARHAIQDAGVGLQDAVPQQVVVVEKVLIRLLLLLHTQRLHIRRDQGLAKKPSGTVVTQLYSR